MGNFNWAVLGLISLSIVACQPAKKYDDPAHHTLTGSVVKAVDDVQAGEFADACDGEFYGKRREIAQQLDRRTFELERLATGGPPAVRKVPVGGTFFTESDFVPGEDRWERSEKGWDAIIARYEAMKDQPTNNLWLNLDSIVRGILVDDKNRAIHGVDTGLDHLGGTLLADLKLRLDACTGNCLAPDLSDDNVRFIARNARMLEFWNQVQDKSTNEAGRRRALKDLKDRVRANSRRYEFYRNTAVRRDDGGDLVLPLSAGDLSGHEHTLAGFIEPVWQSEKRALKIEWNVSPLDELFKILLDRQHPYSRAFVNWNDKIVQLYPGTNTRSIAHEIGHVLGFRDTYYTLYDPKTCRYSIEQNRGDLMSSSQFGSVTGGEWDILEKEYR